MKVGVRARAEDRLRRALRVGVLGGVAFVATASAESVARAQTSPSSRPGAGGAGGANVGGTADPTVVAPVAIDAGSVVYPAGARGDGRVVLEVTVDAEGRVREARAVEGAEPFASAALDATLGWTFTPATRARVPVAARIRMQVDFHAPSTPDASPGEPPAPATSSPVSSAPASPVAPSLAPPQVVLVHGSRHEVGQTQLGGAEVRQIPGAFGDAFRAIELLPGVTPIVSGLPFFFVRGAPPGNVGYFVDGVSVPLLYHLALGPSVIHPALIDHVDFFPGGYPARFGRFAGGILDGETTPPSSRFHGEANVRVFDAGALVEGPVGDKLDVLVAGRYSYTAAMVQLVAPDTRVAYWDYQTRLSYKLSPSERLSVFVFGSFDEIDNRDEAANVDADGHVDGVVKTPFYPVFKTEFHRADLRYDRDSAHGHLRVAATLGVEDSTAGSSATVSTHVAAQSASLRAEGDERLDERLDLRYGADALFYHYGLDASAQSAAQALDPAHDDVTIGAYVDVVWKPWSRVEVVPGLRADVFTTRLSSPDSVLALAATSNTAAALVAGNGANATAVVGIDPRLAVRWGVSRDVTSITTFGVAHQRPSVLVPIPGLALGSLSQGLQTAVQMSQGAEIKLPLDATLTATAFLQEYLGLSDATATCVGADGSLTTNVGIGYGCVTDTVRGQAFGVELLARRDLTERVSGWVSYTLSRSTRQTQGVRSQETTGFGAFPTLQEIPSEFDRTHVLNVVGAVDMGRGWRGGARFYFYTGRPYSPEIDGVSVPPFNSMRLPAFYRIDVRLEKKWPAFDQGYVSLVLEGLNVTLNKEAIDIQCRRDGTLAPLHYDTCSPQYIGPVSVPSIGVEAAF